MAHRVFYILAVIYVGICIGPLCIFRSSSEFSSILIVVSCTSEHSFFWSWVKEFRTIPRNRSAEFCAIYFSQDIARCTPIKCTFVRCTFVRCTFVRCTLVRYTPVRYTPVKYTPKRDPPIRCTLVGC